MSVHLPADTRKFVTLLRELADGLELGYVTAREASLENHVVRSSAPDREDEIHDTGIRTFSITYQHIPLPSVPDTNPTLPMEE